MTHFIGNEPATRTLPVALLLYVIHGRMFAHPCWSADEHLAFVRDMTDAYPSFSFTLYDQPTPDDDDSATSAAVPITSLFGDVQCQLHPGCQCRGKIALDHHLCAFEECGVQPLLCRTLVEPDTIAFKVNCQTPHLHRPLGASPP